MVDAAGEGVTGVAVATRGGGGGGVLSAAAPEMASVVGGSARATCGLAAALMTSANNESIAQAQRSSEPSDAARGSCRRFISNACSAFDSNLTVRLRTT